MKLYISNIGFSYDCIYKSDIIQLPMLLSTSVGIYYTNSLYESEVI